MAARRVGDVRITASARQGALDRALWSRSLADTHLALTTEEREWVIAWAQSRGMSLGGALRRMLRRALVHIRAEVRAMPRIRARRKGG